MTVAMRTVARVRCLAFLLAALVGACGGDPPPPTPTETAAAQAIEEATAKLRDRNIPPEVAAQLLADAESRLEKGEIADAYRSYFEIIQADPTNAKAHLGIAEVFLAAKDYQQALAGFDALSRNAEVVAPAVQGRGLTYLAMGRLDNAKASLEEAVARDPSLWRAWNGLGQISDARRDWGAAAQYYKRALEAEPNAAEIHNSRGVSYLMQGRYGAAEQAFTRALELDAGSENARSNLSITRAWQGRYDEALAGAGPRNQAETFNNVGVVAMRRGDLLQAEVYFLEAMDLSPSYYEKAAVNLAKVRQQIQAAR